MISSRTGHGAPSHAMGPTGAYDSASPKSRRREAEMAWEFETEPEFQQKLDWMRAFIVGELQPLEPILDQLPAEEWAVVKGHLQRQVKAQGLWACHLDPELGGVGFGQM